MHTSAYICCHSYPAGTMYVLYMHPTGPHPPQHYKLYNAQTFPGKTLKIAINTQSYSNSVTASFGGMCHPHTPGQMSMRTPLGLAFSPWMGTLIHSHFPHNMMGHMTYAYHTPCMHTSTGTWSSTGTALTQPAIASLAPTRCNQYSL